MIIKKRKRSEAVNIKSRRKWKMDEKKRIRSRKQCRRRKLRSW